MVLEEFAGQLGSIAAVVGTVTALAYFPQAYKIMKRKSVEDISLVTFTLFFLSVIFWLSYGLSINNFPIIVTNSVGIVGVGTVIALYLHYKKW